MAGFVVADLRDAVVCCVGEPSFNESARVEARHVLLVERVDGPFGAEEVLKEKIVGTRGIV